LPRERFDGDSADVRRNWTVGQVAADFAGLKPKTGVVKRSCFVRGAVVAAAAGGHFPRGAVRAPAGATLRGRRTPT
jgi:hypothetical protein